MSRDIIRKAALTKQRRAIVTHGKDETAVFHFVESGGIDLIINLTREECGLLADILSPPRRSEFDQ